MECWNLNSGLLSIFLFIFLCAESTSAMSRLCVCSCFCMNYIVEYMNSGLGNLIGRLCVRYESFSCHPILVYCNFLILTFITTFCSCIKTRDLNVSAMIICKLIKHVVPGSQPQINRPSVYSLSRWLICLCFISLFKIFLSVYEVCCDLDDAFSVYVLSYYHQRNNFSFI
jgi:hypothetical protein